MRQRLPPSALPLMQANRRPPLISMLMLIVASMAFGTFLHQNESPLFVWIMGSLYIVIQCSILSIAWQPTLQFILLGFKSEVGYSILALAVASSAVIIVTWIKPFSYFLVMFAAALLLRIKLHTRRQGALLSFFVMILMSALGLFISSMPALAKAGYFDAFNQTLNQTLNQTAHHVFNLGH
jgi:hypothetical protein